MPLLRVCFHSAVWSGYTILFVQLVFKYWGRRSDDSGGNSFKTMKCGIFLVFSKELETWNGAVFRVHNSVSQPMLAILFLPVINCPDCWTILFQIFRKKKRALWPPNFVYWQTGKLMIKLESKCNYCGITNDMVTSIITTKSPVATLV